MESYAPAFDPAGKYLYFLSRRELRPLFSPSTLTLGFDKATRVSVISLAADTRSPFLKLDDEEGIKSEAAKKDETKKDEAKKEETPKPADVKIDLAGIADRIADVPVPGDRYVSLAALEDRLLLSILIDPADPDNDKTKPRYQLRALSLKDLRKNEVTTVVEKMTSFALSDDGKKLLVRSGHDLTVGASDAAPMKDPEP